MSRVSTYTGKKIAVFKTGGKVMGSKGRKNEKKPKQAKQKSEQKPAAGKK